MLIYINIYLSIYIYIYIYIYINRYNKSIYYTYNQIFFNKSLLIRLHIAKNYLILGSSHIRFHRTVLRFDSI